jgi:transcription elongation regulator 1
LRVTTTLGKTFYTHSLEKRSVWVVPDEVKHALEQMDINGEQEPAELPRKKHAKRKAPPEQQVPVEEIVVVTKKPKVDADAGEDEDSDEDEEEQSEEEEEWQREAAAQLAAEAEEEKRIREEEEKRAREAEEAAAKENAQQLRIPDRVDLSIEEGKALFKACSLLY